MRYNAKKVNFMDRGGLSDPFFGLFFDKILLKPSKCWLFSTIMWMSGSIRTSKRLILAR